MKHEISSTLKLPAITGMNLEQIKDAIARGRTVHWANRGYEVIRDSVPQYLIHCTMNDSYIGLTHMDGETMNGEEKQFFSPAVEYEYYAVIHTGDDVCRADAVNDITNEDNETVESEIFDALESLCLNNAHEKLKEECS